MKIRLNPMTKELYQPVLQREIRQQAIYFTMGLIAFIMLINQEGLVPVLVCVTITPIHAFFSYRFFLKWLPLIDKFKLKVSILSTLLFIYGSGPLLWVHIIWRVTQLLIRGRNDRN
jgi:hypothetical protein